MLNVFDPNLKWLCYGLLVAITAIPMIVKVPVFVQLFIVSVTVIYLGCRAGIHVGEGKKTRERAAADSEDMSMKDAYMFPVYASLTLFSLYVVIKYVDKQILAAIVSFHFSLLGVFCLMSITEKVLEPFLGHLKSVQVYKREVNLDLKIKKFNFNVDINRLNIVSFSVAMIPTTLHIITKSWITNNIFGTAFCITGIQTLVLPNFKVGFMLLWGLFFYDIFWVYGTDVMVTVAKNIDAPIKFIFPVDLAVSPPKFSMLGLGDIVIPGVFIALCLHFDVDKQIIKAAGKLANVDAKYFKICMIGYAIGIIATFQIMLIFEHAQPALLYLVPSCTLSILIPALQQKEVKTLFTYEENAARTAELAATAKKD